MPAVLCTCLLYTADFSSGQLHGTVSILNWINCQHQQQCCHVVSGRLFSYFFIFSITPLSHIILLYFGHTCLNKDRKAAVKFFTFLPFQQSGQRYFSLRKVEYSWLLEGFLYILVVGSSTHSNSMYFESTLRSRYSLWLTNYVVLDRAGNHFQPQFLFHGETAYYFIRWFYQCINFLYF